MLEAKMTRDSLPDCLYYLLMRASLVATSVLKKDRAVAGVGQVKPAFLGVLLVLWESDGLQAAEVARRAGLEPSTTTGLLDRLEKLELVERRADPDDRRAVRIHLAAGAQSLEKKVRSVVNRVLAKAGEGIDPRDLEVTRKVLKQILMNSLSGPRD
jgi:MarR family transcriptional regulator, organic hydroperoxide resistance regulator